MARSQLFSSADFDKAFELERGREREGWNRTGRAYWDGGAEFWKMMDYDADVPLHIKATLPITGVPLENCYDLLTTPETRNQWDEEFFQLEKLKWNGPGDSQYANEDMIYWIFHLPPAVQDRDMVQYVTDRWFPKEKARVILYKQGENASKPEGSDYIRMTTGLSYTILRPMGDDPSSTMLSTLGNNDFGGWLPLCIMGYLYSRSMTGLKQRLLQAYTTNQ